MDISTKWEELMREAVENTFRAMFALEELRQIWRETAPEHRLDNEQVANAKQLIGEIRAYLDYISERLAMALEDARDIRVLVYPQLSEQAEFTDEDIARSLSPEREPKSKQGTELVAQLVTTALANKSRIGPTAVLAYDGDLLGAHVKVFVYNWDEDKPLLGRAITNRVFVYDNGIYGVPVEQLSEVEDISDRPAPVKVLYEVWERGTDTGLWLVELMMKRAVADLESAIERHEGTFDMRVRAMKKPSHINIHVPKNIEEYIEMRKKPIKVVGPVFAGVKAEIIYDTQG